MPNNSFAKHAKRRNPKVSIILCTYNRAHLISRAVDSILQQSFIDYELIIINDGSTDNTEEVINKYNDRRVHLLMTNNKGPATARNLGLKIAKGEYIAYFDDDNVAYPNHLKILVHFLDTHPSVGLVYSNCFECMDNEKPSEINIGFDKRLLETTNFLYVLCILHRKSCLKKVGFFDEKLRACEDWDMWLRISDSYQICHIPIALGNNFYNSKPIFAISTSKHLGKHLERVVRKRVERARLKNALTDYINDCSIGIIRHLLSCKNSSFASHLTKEFRTTINNYQTLTCSGMCYLSIGKFKIALKMLREGLMKLPSHWQGLNSWEIENIMTLKTLTAKAYYHTGKTRLAIKFCTEVLRIKPKNIDARVQLSMCYAHIKQYKRAIRILAGIQYNSATYNLRACCYFKMGNPQQAIKELERATILEPNESLYHYNLARIYASLGKYSKAQTEYQKTIQLKSLHLHSKSITLTNGKQNKFKF